LRQPVGFPLAGAQALLALGERLVALGQCALADLQLLQLSLLEAGALVRPSLEPLPFLPPAVALAVQVLALLERLHLGPDQHLLARRFAVPGGFPAETLTLRAGRRQDARRGLPLSVSVHRDREERHDQTGGTDLPRNVGWARSPTYRTVWSEANAHEIESESDVALCSED